MPCASFSYDALTAPIRIQMSQSQRFTFDTDLRVKLQLPQAVQFSISPCTPDPSHPTIPVVCSGNSDTIIYDVGSELDLVVPSGEFHTTAITPTFYLLNPTLDNFISTNLRVDGKLIAVQASRSIPDYVLLEPFTVIPEICIFDLCTPALEFPGLFLPGTLIQSQNIGRAILGDLLDDFLASFGIGFAAGPPYEDSIGPVFKTSLPGLAVTDNDMFDRAPSPWPLQGVDSVVGTPFTIDAEVQPTAVLTGDVALDEGEEGAFDGSGSLEIDFDEFLTFEFDYGDGITDFSFDGSVGHAFLDDGDLTVNMAADDEHQLPGTAAHQVRVNNVSPTLTTGGKSADEGSLVDLSPEPFNRELLANRGAEESATGLPGWTVAGGVVAQPYNPQGTSRPVRAAVLVDNDTQGYYADLGTILHGVDPEMFPHTYEIDARVVLFEDEDFGGEATVYGPGGSRSVATPPGSIIADGDRERGINGLEIIWFPEPEFEGTPRFVNAARGDAYSFFQGCGFRLSCNDALTLGPWDTDGDAVRIARAGTPEDGFLYYVDDRVGQLNADCLQRVDNGSLCEFYAPSTIGSFIVSGQRRGLRNPFRQESEDDPGSGQVFPLRILQTYAGGVDPIRDLGFGYHEYFTPSGTGEYAIELDAGAEAWFFEGGFDQDRSRFSRESRLGELQQRIAGP